MYSALRFNCCDLTQIRTLQAETLPGYKLAIASIWKEGPLHGLVSAFEWIGRHNPPFRVLIIHVRANIALIGIYL